MRKIESEMLAAVRSRRDWSKDNTSVSNTNHGVVVRLHGNKIAILNDEHNKLVITDAGWQTVTTKSRLNALLGEFCFGSRIYAKNFEWFLSNKYDDKEPISIDHQQAYPVELG